MFVSHPLCAAAAFMAFALIGARRRPFAAALLTGLVTLFEYQGAMLSLVLGLYALFSYRDRRSRLLFVAGAALCAALLLTCQRLAFGHALRTPFAYLADEKLRAGHVRGLVGLGLPQAGALWALCFDRTVGLFGTSPFLWLLVPAFVMARQAREVRWAFAICVVLLLTMSGITNWRAGWSIGPRYLVPIMPFAVFVIANGAARLLDRGRLAVELTRGVAAGLSAASALTIGLIAIVINTLPYDIVRPLGQVAIPFLRAGFVPYHLGDLVGWHAPTFAYVAVLALLCATVVPLLVRAREGWLRWPAALLVCAIGVAPALPSPSLECPRGVRRLSEIWEPQGRDRIQRLRRAAAANPCEWRTVARLERALCWEGAADDAAKAEDLDCRAR